MNNVKQFLNRVNVRNLTGTQRVLRRMLLADGAWLSVSELRRAARNLSTRDSVTARVRELRSAEFGGFTVECTTVNRGGREVFVYRIDPRNVRTQQVARVLEV